jgi:hypothetical protein
MTPKRSLLCKQGLEKRVGAGSSTYFFYRKGNGLQPKELLAKYSLQKAAKLLAEGSVDQIPVFRGEPKELVAGGGGGLKEDVPLAARGVPLTIDLNEHAGKTIERRIHTHDRDEQLLWQALELHLCSGRSPGRNTRFLLLFFFGVRGGLPLARV